MYKSDLGYVNNECQISYTKLDNYSMRASLNIIICVQFKLVFKKYIYIYIYIYTYICIYIYIYINNFISFGEGSCAEVRMSTSSERMH